MTERELQNQIRVALSEYGAVFRMNAGKFWQGKLRGDILTDLRAVEGLPEGFPDLLFIGENGRVAFIEVKTPAGRIRESQKKFMDFLYGYEHQVGVARSVEDAVSIATGEKILLPWRGIIYPEEKSLL